MAGTLSILLVVTRVIVMWELEGGCLLVGFEGILTWAHAEQEEMETVDKQQFLVPDIII